LPRDALNPGSDGSPRVLWGRAPVGDVHFWHERCPETGHPHAAWADRRENILAARRALLVPFKATVTVTAGGKLERDHA